MKKTLLATTFLVAGTVGLLAQGTFGTIVFDNQPYNFDNSIELGGTVEYKIYASGTANPDGSITGTLASNPAWRAFLYQSGNAIGAGLPIVDGVLDTANGANRTLGTAPGVATSLEVRIFESAGGNLLGSSAPFAYTPPSDPLSPPGAYYMANFRGFVVPEPSTVALGVLGLGALLLFRRRK
jgi:hypothetical protein